MAAALVLVVSLVLAIMLPLALRRAYVDTRAGLLLVGNAWQFRWPDGRCYRTRSHVFTHQNEWRTRDGARATREEERTMNDAIERWRNDEPNPWAES